MYNLSTGGVILDFAIKIIGLLLTVTVFPPAVLYAVLINFVVMFGANSWSHSNN